MGEPRTNERSTSPPALALRELMEKWSEENWAAGWLMGLEFILWRGVEKGNFPALAWLAEQAGGWWTFEEFVPLDEWREKFRVAEAAHA